MSSTGKYDFPIPKFIEGGCLCEALRYRVDFPDDHDFKKACGTCQCSQCRKQSGALFFPSHHIEPASAFKWTSDTATLKHFSVSPGADRGFCGQCGSFLYWKRKDDRYVCITVGTVDPLFLFGEGADGQTVPKGGYGLALVNGEGHHLYRANDIPGVTDNMPLLAKGSSFPGDDWTEAGNVEAMEKGESKEVKN